MCELCVLGLRDPSEHFVNSQSAGTGDAMAAAKPSLNYDQAADKIAAYGWTSTATPITYAFRGSNASDPGFARFTSAQIEASEKALSLWADVANISFQRVGAGSSGNQAYSNDASILFSVDKDSGGYAWAYFPGSRSSTSVAGDVFINTSNGWFSDVSAGSYDFTTLIHEIGHAIGLNHPGAYNGGSPTYATDAEYAEDSSQYTVMSYFDASATGANHSWISASTPLLHDIAAAQLLYGANMSTRASDTVYGFNSNADRDVFHVDSATEKVVFAIWDAGGYDTLDFSGYNVAQRIDLNQEAFSDVGGLTKNIAIAKGAVIEKAIGGSAGDTLVGNAGDNVLDGRGGADQLYGGSGNDWLEGGAGNDLMHGGEGDDTIVYDTGDTVTNLDGGAGFDTLFVHQMMAPTTFNLAGRGFEQGIVQLDDVSNLHAWSSKTMTYNAVWQQTAERGTFDSGARWTKEFDVANAEAWTSRQTDVDTVGRTTLVSTALDDGRRTDVAHDAANTQSWRTVTSTFDTAGRMSARTTLADDNQSDVETFDAGNAYAWSSVSRHLNASGVATHQTTAMDNGGRFNTSFDYQSIYTWSEFTRGTNAEGARTSQTTKMDDGRTFATSYDVASAYAWMEFMTATDGQGQRISQTTKMDDGRIYTTAFDASDAYAWSEFLTSSNAAGERVSQTTKMDDGRSFVTNFDVADAFGWASQLHIYDASGALSSTRYTGDDGVVWTV